MVAGRQPYRPVYTKGESQWHLPTPVLSPHSLGLFISKGWVECDGCTESIAEFLENLTCLDSLVVHGMFLDARFGIYWTDFICGK